MNSLRPIVRICLSCAPDGRTIAPFLRHGRAGQEILVDSWGPRQLRHRMGWAHDPSCDSVPHILHMGCRAQVRVE